MLFWVLSAFVYVFFVYGIIAFIKNIYNDYIINRSVTRKIEVLIDKNDDIESIIRLLKRDFNHIVLVLKEYNEQYDKILDISKDIKIEYKLINDIRRVENS